MKNLFQKMFTMASVLMLTAACDKTDRSFSLLSEGESFQQSATYTPQKIDILWIIDNSGSMESSQTNLINNFGSFITNFQTKQYDFRMAVQTTDAWMGKFRAEDYRRRVRDGSDNPCSSASPCPPAHSGVFVMNNLTPNLSDVFLTNARQGIAGNGDERAFSSFEDTLDYTGNNDFHRAGAYLAIIIVSDEDDFSSTTQANLFNNYSAANLVPVQHYKDFLDTNYGAGNYSVNAITIMDNQCLSNLNASFSGRLIGQRYLQLADLTGGVKTSLCDDFGVNLQLISDLILSNSQQTFTLDREPIASTIRVLVDGVEIFESATDGWTYNSTNLELSFVGAAIPAAGAQVQIFYDPKNARN